ncbi:MAG: FG-GAP repeat protein, partial [Planctomycetales bacterium]|nr:FG-GAP repeat protein [Planctomycetales bacterium]
MRLQTKHYRAALGHTFERMESRVQVKYRLHMESLESRRVLASSVGFISAPLVLQDDLGGNVVAIGDIDGDGKNDIVGTRFPVRADESPLYLIRDEMGHGVFGGKKESIDSNMGDITDLKLVDLDVDGDLDVFAYRRCVFSGCSFGALYENVDGAGRFEERPIPVSIENGWIEVADIDADGDPDIVATSTDCLFTCTFSDLSWYENTGRFTSFVKHPIQIMTGWSDRFSFM